MKTLILKRTIVSLVVATLISIVATGVYAGYYVYVDDGQSGFTTSGSIWDISECTFSTCQAGDARMGWVDNGATGFWTTHTAHITGISTWIPNPIPDTYATVTYHVYSNASDFSQTVIQPNWRGHYVWLGYLDWSGSGSWAQIVLPTSCASGYYCGSKPVVYDLSKFWVP